MKNPKDRWRIEGTLTSVDPLRIGCGHRSGSRIEGKDGEDPPEVALVEAYYDKEENGRLILKPYLTATGLKGALRAYLEDLVGRGDARLESLLGREPRPMWPQGAKKDGGVGGKAEFHDAPRISAAESGLPEFSPDHGTFVTTSVRIDRDTGAVKPRYLYSAEAVPPRTEFKVTVDVIGGTKEEVELLVAAIQSFGSGDSNSATRTRLGAEGRAAMGRLDWKLERISATSKESVTKWLEAHGRKPWSEALADLTPADSLSLVTAADQLVFGARQRLNMEHPRIDLTVLLSFDGAFLVKDPRRTDGETDARSIDDHDGIPALPARSFLGALRAQAERVFRTVHPDEERSDPVRRLFGDVDAERGALGRALAVREIKFVDARDPLKDQSIDRATLLTSKAARKAITLKHEMVAIDRFTGGVSGSKKFDFRPYWRPRFEVSLTLWLDRKEKEPIQGGDLGLLALVFRDLIEGDISFGMGSSRGYGRATAKIQWSHHGAVVPDDMKERIDETTLTTDWLSPLQECVTTFRVAASTRPPPLVHPQAHDSRIAAPTPNQGDKKQFHSPYAFSPLATPKWPAGTSLSTVEFTEGKLDRFGHARYQPGALSGRISCVLRTEDPVVVGGEHKGRKGNTTLVTPFEVDGAPAIPATSLRGLFSSIAEAASQSAPRVLHDARMSFRKPVEAALSAIGMICQRGDEYRLLPLTLPTLKVKGSPQNPVWSEAIPAEYKALFNGLPLRVYVDFYDQRPGPNGKMRRDLEASGFLRGKMSYESGAGQEFQIDPNQLVFKTKRDDQETSLIGYSLRQGQPLPLENGGSVRPGWQLGILKVLGRRARMPNPKKHEFFVPVPEDWERRPFDQLIEIDPLALQCFEDLADEVTETSDRDSPAETDALPYHNRGRNRPPSQRDPRDKEQRRWLRLRHHDLVYFSMGQNNKVVELSVSAVWRGAVPQKVHDFFHARGADFVPFHLDDRLRRVRITPAELLFGFVAYPVGKNVAPSAPRAYRSRVRFSHGRLQGSRADAFLSPAPVMLKTLASPKLPCPEMYFQSRTASDGLISKTDLRPNLDKPLGRKFYLHPKAKRLGTDKAWAFNPEPPASDAKTRERHLSASPIAPDRNFDFEVDFENLNPWELGLLAYALRPTNQFRHKLGLGKPIGLGRIEIRASTVEFIDRFRRYAIDQLTDARYHDRHEAALNEETGLSPILAAYRAVFTKDMDTDVDAALRAISEPDRLRAPVHYPKTRPGAGGAGGGEEGYRWFVDNRKGRKERLRPIDANGLPLLRYTE